MKVGDLVRTIAWKGWSYKTGIVVGMEASEDWAQILWTDTSTTDGQIFWAPVRKLELVNASR